jgi:hypothetical protein
MTTYLYNGMPIAAAMEYYNKPGERYQMQTDRGRAYVIDLQTGEKKYAPQGIAAHLYAQQLNYQQGQSRTGGMMGSSQMSGGQMASVTTPQLTDQQKAANEGAYNLGRQNLEDEYNKLSQGVVNSMNRRGMFGSSVANEDQGQVQKGLARGLADLENRRQMGMFTTQGQDISNQAALQNMAVQQQQLAMQQRQQQQAEQAQLMKLLGY